MAKKISEKIDKNEVAMSHKFNPSNVRRKVRYTTFAPMFGSKALDAQVQLDYQIRPFISDMADIEQEHQVAEFTEETCKRLYGYSMEELKNATSSVKEATGSDEPIPAEMTDIKIQAKDPGVTVFSRVSQELADSLKDFQPELQDLVGCAFHYGYVIKGNWKSNLQSLKSSPGLVAYGMTSWKSTFTKMVYPHKRVHVIFGPDGKPLGRSRLKIVQRPLRSNGPSGEHVCLARSEVIPAGSYMDVEIFTTAVQIAFAKGYANNNTWDLMSEIMTMGQYCGIGQWTSGGWGVYRWQPMDDAKWNIADPGFPANPKFR
jgi:hypothetical protein